MTWMVNAASYSGLWDIYLEVSYDCLFSVLGVGYFCTNERSQSFRIKKSLQIGWNYDTVNNVVIDPSIPLYSLDCATCTNCSTCSEGYVFFISSYLAGASVSLSLECDNCYIKGETYLMNFNLEISASRTAVLINMTGETILSATLVLALDANFQGANETNLVSWPILGKEFNILGVHIVLGAFFDFGVRVDYNVHARAAIQAGSQ